MTERTPRVWFAAPFGTDLWNVWAGQPTNAELVVTTSDSDIARLIAAAPALYEALKRIVALGEDDEHEPTYAWKDAFEAGAAALAIAERKAH